MTDKPTPTTDLLKRCAEIHEWRSTGVLSGEALRDYAKRKWPDRHDTLQMAEHETVTEALALLAKRGQPAAEPSRFGSPELQAMIIARCVEKDQADSVQEDAARLDFLIEQRAYVVSDPDACPGYWLHWAMPDGRTWVQGDEHPTPRAAIDAGRKQGARWKSAVRALTLHI